MSDDHFLSRWSRRKHAVKRGEPVKDPEPPPAMPAAVAASNVAEAPAETPPELPPVESLTPESDFTPFMRSEVDPKTRQQALRTLFRDERFNVMDGLDVYIDDYSKPDPIPADWLGKLNQMARLGDYRPPEKENDAEGTPEPVPASPANSVDEQTVATGPSVEALPPEEPELPPPDLKHS